MTNSKSNIPLVDTAAQYRAIKKEIDETAIRVFESGRYIGGPELEAFERDFAEYLGVKFAIGCSSGTTAIQVALQAYGISAGDEVILPANTFIATAEAVSNVGARPVFVDIDAETNAIAPDKIHPAISAKTKAIIVVHLFGQPADMKSIVNICQNKKIILIEDCAQSHGAIYYGIKSSGQKTGSIGDAGCFSFFPAKNLGAFGDAGMVVTDDEKKAKLVRMLINHGREEKYTHDIIGNNFRMDPLQAALLRVKLKKLERWNDRRLEIAKRYIDTLKDLPFQLPKIYNDSKPVFHIFAIRTDVRSAVAEHLKKNGIQTGVHYPLPLHLQPAYKSLGYMPGDFPEAEQAAKELLSIPIYPELTNEQVDYIIEKIRECF